MGDTVLFAARVPPAQNVRYFSANDRVPTCLLEPRELRILATTSSTLSGRFPGTTIFATLSVRVSRLPPGTAPFVLDVGEVSAAAPKRVEMCLPIFPVGVGVVIVRSGTEKLRRLCCVFSAVFFLENTLMLGSSGT